RRLNAADDAAGNALKGRINHSVCKWCYPKVSLEDLCKAGKQMGLHSVELLTVTDFPTLKKHDLICAMVSGVPGGIDNGLNRLENHDKIAAFFEETVPIVANAGYPNIICFSGNRRGMDDQKGIENCAIGIKKFIAIAEKHKVNVVMELRKSKFATKNRLQSARDGSGLTRRKVLNYDNQSNPRRFSRYHTTHCCAQRRKGYRLLQRGFWGKRDRPNARSRWERSHAC